MWFFSLVVCLIVVAVSFLFGIFGFAQLIGSITNINERGIKWTLVTTIMWLAIIGAVTYCIINYLPQYLNYYLVGMGLSFVIIIVESVRKGIK